MRLWIERRRYMHYTKEEVARIILSKDTKLFHITRKITELKRQLEEAEKEAITIPAVSYEEHISSGAISDRTYNQAMKRLDRQNIIKRQLEHYEAEKEQVYRIELIFEKMSLFIPYHYELYNEAIEAKKIRKYTKVWQDHNIGRKTLADMLDNMDKAIADIANLDMTNDEITLLFDDELEQYIDRDTMYLINKWEGV